HKRLDNGVVAVEDRLGGESRHSREGEDELGDDGATEQGADLEAYDGDGWNERIAEGVLAEHADVIKALRARRAHVVLANDFEHGRAYGAGDDADAVCAEGYAWKYQRGRRGVTEDRE